MWLFRSGFVLFAYTLIIVYTGIKVRGLVKHFLPSVKSYVFWPVYVIFGYFYVLVFLLRLDRIWLLRQAAMYSLPLIIYFFLVLLVFDGVWLVLRSKKSVSLSRWSSAGAAGIALGLAVLAMVYGNFNARNIRTVHYGITLNKAVPGSSGREAGLRIALVSDIHIGRTVNRKWVANIVDVVNRTNPDMICIAGDIFDNNIEMVSDLEGVAEELRRLNAPLGVYACQGNHDVDRFSLREEGKTDRIKEFLVKAEINFLLDEVILVADRFYLAGRRDARLIGGRQTRKSAAELAAGLDKSKPLIFMDHQPVDYQSIEETGADLIFSGHTHRGQFFPGNLATAYIYKKAGAVHYGYWQGRSAQALVSSGAGLWGPPIRIATRSEVAVVDVYFSK